MRMCHQTDNAIKFKWLAPVLIIWDRSHVTLNKFVVRLINSLTQHDLNAKLNFPVYFLKITFFTRWCVNADNVAVAQLCMLGLNSCPEWRGNGKRERGEGGRRERGEGEGGGGQRERGEGGGERGREGRVPCSWPLMCDKIRQIAGPTWIWTSACIDCRPGQYTVRKFNWWRYCLAICDSIFDHFPLLDETVRHRALQ